MMNLYCIALDDFHGRSFWIFGRLGSLVEKKEYALDKIYVGDIEFASQMH